MDRIIEAERRLSGLSPQHPDRATATVTLARAVLIRSPHRAAALAAEVASLPEVDARARFDAVYLIASARLMTSDFDGAPAAIDDAERLARTPAHRARVESLRAIRAQRAGDLAGALARVLEALQLWEAADTEDLPGSATTHNIAGNLFAQFGDFPGAIEQFQLASSRVGHDAEDDVSAVVANNLGRAYREQGQHADAEDVLRTALTRFPDTDASLLRCSLLCNLGVTQVDAGHAALARTTLNEALRRSERAGFARIEAAALHALGLAYAAEGAMEAARLELEAALRIRTQLKEQVDVAETRVRLAEVLHALGRTEEAEALLAAVVDGPEATAWPRARADALHLLYRIHRQNGDLAKALDHHVAWVEIAQAYSDDRARSRYQVLQARFRHEQLARERELERARRAALEDLAHTDALTGVHNRRYADRHLDLLHAIAGAPFSVALLDLDFFKQINDAHSHELGDAVLRTTARVLAAQLRHGDVIARYGGEEFVLVFANATAEQAQTTCERLLATLRGFDWTALHPAIAVTASVGVADSRQATDRESLLRAADRALYRAKALGRDRVQRA